MAIEMSAGNKRRNDKKTTTQQSTSEEISLAEMTSGEDLGVINYVRLKGAEGIPSPESELSPAARRERTDRTKVTKVVDKNEWADGLEKKERIKINTERIAALKESSEFLHKDLQ